MVHIDNIPHILENGITHSSSLNSNPNYAPIGDGSIISARNSFQLNNGRKLGDYIPFYFGKCSPMLYVIQNGFNGVTSTSPSKIVYIVISIQGVIDQNLDFLFTSGHAISNLTTQHTPADINNIYQIVDKDAVKDKFWVDDYDLDKKRRKEAEFLVLGDINANAILGYIVYSQAAKDRLEQLGINASIIFIQPQSYF